MKVSKFSVALSYMLLIILLVVAASIYVRQNEVHRSADSQLSAFGYTPTLISEGSDGGADRYKTDVTGTEILQPQSPGLQTEADNNGNRAVDLYPPPGQTEIAQALFSGGTPYPGIVQPDPNRRENSLAYPGQGTEAPVTTQAPTIAQAVSPVVATPTAMLPSTATPVIAQLQPALTPSATPTQSIIRTDIQPSDPRSFQVVSGKVQFVEFFAYWSPVSKSMAPVINMLADRYEDRINFVFLDIDAPGNGLYKQMIGDRLPPIFFLIDPQGAILKMWDGYVQPLILEEALQPFAP